MKRINLFNSITLVLTFLALSVPKMESQIMPPVIIPLSPPSRHPLCASQLSLVYYACAMVSFTPGLPSSPLTTSLSVSSPNGESDGHSSHHHSHGHRHGHRNRHSHSRTPQEENCCRWAREIDSQCICEILVRLPLFLTRPVHQYSIAIGESCNVTYSCGGPI